MVDLTWAVCANLILAAHALGGELPQASVTNYARDKEILGIGEQKVVICISWPPDEKAFDTYAASSKAG